MRRSQSFAIQIIGTGGPFFITITDPNNNNQQIHRDSETNAPFCWPTSMSQTICNGNFDATLMNHMNKPLVVTASDTSPQSASPNIVNTIFFASSTTTFNSVSSGLMSGLPSQAFQIQGFTVLDCNNDLRDDVLVYVVGDEDLYVCVNQGASVRPLFACTRISSSHDGGVAVGDVDGDGFVDIVMNTITGDNPQVLKNPGTTNCLPGGGTNNWATSADGMQSSQSTARMLFDLDADGDLDVVGPGSSFMWHRRNPAPGGFDSQVALPGVTSFPLTASFGASAALINNDDALDIVYRYENNSTPTAALFASQSPSGFSFASASYASADFDLLDWVWGDCDRDMRQDLFVVTSTGTAGFYKNVAGLHVPQAPTGSVTQWPIQPRSAAWLDGNGDGLMDIFVSELSSSNPKLYLGGAGCTFSASTTTVTGGNNVRTDRVIAFDIDSDGDEDVVFKSHSTMSLEVGVFYNQVNPVGWFRVRAIGAGSMSVPFGARIVVYESLSSNKTVANSARSATVLPSFGRAGGPLQPTFALRNDSRYDVQVIFPPLGASSLAQRTRTLAAIIPTRVHHVTIRSTDPDVAFATQKPTLTASASMYATGDVGVIFSLPANWVSLAWPSSERLATDRAQIDVQVTSGTLSFNGMAPASISSTANGAQAMQFTTPSLTDAVSRLNQLRWLSSSGQIVTLTVSVSDALVSSFNNVAARASSATLTLNPTTAPPTPVPPTPAPTPSATPSPTPPTTPMPTPAAPTPMPTPATTLTPQPTPGTTTPMPTFPTTPIPPTPSPPTPAPTTSTSTTTSSSTATSSTTTSSSTTTTTPTTTTSNVGTTTTSTTTSVGGDSSTTPSGSDVSTTETGTLFEPGCAPVECTPPSTTEQCVALTYNAANLTVDSSSASLTVCGVTLTVEAGEGSVLAPLVGGGVGANAARRRSIATNASLAFSFSEAVFVASVELRDVDGADSGVVELADAAMSTANVTSNSVDVSSSGQTSTLTLRATAGDGFGFVTIVATRKISLSGASSTSAAGDNATTSAVGDGNQSAALAPEETKWGGLVWWYWIIIICGVLVCLAVIIGVVAYRVCRGRDDDDESDEAGMWEMESSAPGSEMFSARAGGADDDDPNLEFRSRRASLTPSMSAALTSNPEARTFATSNSVAATGLPDGSVMASGTYRPVSTVSSPAPFLAPAESVSSSSGTMLPPPPSSTGTLDQYQALPAVQTQKAPPNNYVQGQM